ncbi:MAG: ComF family protein [Candidatus Komeilibacteria bacterium]
MKKIFKLILDFIFPIECIHCNKEGKFLCSDCFNTINLRTVKQCPLCNKEQTTDKLCNTCKSKSYLDEVIICADYSNEILQKTIHYYKYKYIKDLNKPLSKLMLNKLESIKLPKDILIIPTPLHKKRELERGFNQSILIANNLNLPTLLNVLYRKKNIKHQAELNKKQRLKNIKDCFTIQNIKEIQNKNILLIDDVITTGSTLNEQAKLLKKNNAHKVWALVIAKN